MKKDSDSYRKMKTCKRDIKPEPDAAYLRVLKDVISEDVRIIGFDSPARTSGTALLRVLSESPDTNAYCYEPFRRPVSSSEIIKREGYELNTLSDSELNELQISLKRKITNSTTANQYLRQVNLFRAFREEVKSRHIGSNIGVHKIPDRKQSGYTTISDLIDFYRTKKYSDRTISERKVFIIKELSKNIAPEKSWDEWTKVTDKIVFLIRNPLLQLESLTKALARDIQTRDEMQDINFDEYAEELCSRYHLDLQLNETNRWNSLLAQLSVFRDYRPLDKIISLFLDRTKKVSLVILQLERSY